MEASVARTTHTLLQAKANPKPRCQLCTRQPIPNIRSGRNKFVAAAGALPDAATVITALKGPTVSELLSYGQAALSVAGAAWQAVTAPFTIFGTDRWGLNVLFIMALGLLGYNLIIQAPKQ